MSLSCYSRSDHDGTMRHGVRCDDCRLDPVDCPRCSMWRSNLGANFIAAGLAAALCDGWGNYEARDICRRYLGMPPTEFELKLDEAMREGARQRDAFLASTPRRIPKAGAP